MKKIYGILLILLIAGCSPAKRRQQIQVQPRREEALVSYTPLPKKYRRPKIVIDAGHGGKDQGAKSPHSQEMVEKDLTLYTAKLLDRYLTQLGYETILVRSHDIFIPLSARAEFANANQPDLFISVHYNAAPSKSAEGVEVYYYQGESSRTAKSKKLAKTVLDNIITSTKAKSRGTKSGNFAVIRETTMPAILVEAGFLTHAGECKKIEDPNYRNRVAQGIAQGIREYVRKK